MNLWEVLCDHLSSKGHDEDDLCSLRKFIDAIEDPIELPRVLENLLQITSFLQRIDKLYSEFDFHLPVSSWTAICVELKNDPAMQELLIATNKKGKMPLRGYYDTNPVYVAVWQRPGSVTGQQAYFQLLAHCLIAVTILRVRMNKQSSLGVSEQELDNYNISAALLAVRNLSLPENFNILELLPNLIVEPVDLLEILEKSNDKLSPLKVLLKYLLSLRRPPHRHGADNRDPSAKPESCFDIPAYVSEIASNLEPEQEDGASIFDLFQLPVVVEAKAIEIEQLGCSSTESCSGIEIIAPRLNKDVSKQIKSSAQRGLQKRKIKNQLAMINQRLATRWERLSLYEVSVFLTAIADLIKNRERSAYLPDNANYGELAALLITMFWYGQRLERITSLNVYHHTPGIKDAGPGFVSVAGDNGYWWTKPAVPVRKKLPDRLQQEQAYSIVSNYALYSGIGFEKIICAYLSNSHRGRSNRLFFKDMWVYEKMVSGFISSVNGRNSTRLTTNRISDYLFDVISSQDDADLTTAMFIIGREHFLGRNPSYYTSISVAHLQAIYTEVCRNIRDRHFSEKPRDNQKLINNELTGCWRESNQAIHVGSPFRPTSHTVANLVAELKASLRRSAKAAPDVSKLMRIHNCMTRYTAYMIAFSTGFRAIRDPFLSAAEIDWDSGFAVLSDKDNEDGYNSRLIWLPPVCLQQLKFFQEHQQNALYRFNILMPDLFSAPDRPRRDAPGRYMFFSKEDEKSGEYESLTLRPSLLGRNLHSLYALPFNASRHYIRSCLLERRCPIEVINAFMGHFERGEEPWGVFSGLSAIAYRNSLMDVLVPLLDQDGWEALPGLKARL